MDHAWDWGRMPSRGLAEGVVGSAKKSPEMERRSSGPKERSEGYDAGFGIDFMPPAGMDHATLETRDGLRGSLPGKLRNLEESPFTLIMEMGDGRSHSFEIALCDQEDFAPGRKASVSSLVGSNSV